MRHFWVHPETAWLRKARKVTIRYFEQTRDYGGASLGKGGGTVKTGPRLLKKETNTYRLRSTISQPTLLSSFGCKRNKSDNWGGSIKWRINTLRVKDTRTSESNPEASHPGSKEEKEEKIKKELGARKAEEPTRAGRKDSEVTAETWNW